MGCERSMEGKWEGCGIGRAWQKKLSDGTDKPKAVGDMWYIDGTSIKGTNATKGPFPSNSFAVMLIEAFYRTNLINSYLRSGNT